MIVKKHRVGTLATLIVALLFAQCLLLTVLFGVQSYRAVTASTDYSYARRVALSYLTQRVRAYDRRDAVAVGKLQNVDALYCYETADGAVYQTILYVYDGWMRELYTAAGQDFMPADGTPLIEAQALSLSQDGELLHIVLTDSNGKDTVGVLRLRGGAA